MRLIDEKDTLPKIDEAFLKFAEHDDVLRLYSDARLAVINAPTIDPESLRPKGEWLDAPYVYFGAKRYVCSQCSDDEYWQLRFHIVKENFCPNCGADMRGDMHE